MSLIVQKYGGTSVGKPERIQAVAERVKRTVAQGHSVVVVVSAMSGETDRLLGLARAIQNPPSARELDVVLSTGEQVTIGLMAMALEACGVPAVSYTGAQVKILTDTAYNKARIVDIDAAPVREDLARGKVVVIAGFQGVDPGGSITTLGRGGSDTTAVADRTTGPISRIRARSTRRRSRSCTSAWKITPTIISRRTTRRR